MDKWQNNTKQLDGQIKFKLAKKCKYSHGCYLTMVDCALAQSSNQLDSVKWFHVAVFDQCQGHQHGGTAQPSEREKNEIYL